MGNIVRMPIALLRVMSIRILNVSHLPAINPVPTKELSLTIGLECSEGRGKKKWGITHTFMHHSHNLSLPSLNESDP